MTRGLPERHRGQRAGRIANRPVNASRLNDPVFRGTIIRGRALFLIFFAVIIERRRRRVAFCAGLTRLLRDCRTRHRLPRGKHHHRNGCGQNCTHRHCISHCRSPDLLRRFVRHSSDDLRNGADRTRRQWWREVMTSCMRRCAALRIRSGHVSHAIQHDALGHSRIATRSRLRITPIRKSCAGFAAYRIENANLFFAFHL